MANYRQIFSDNENLSEMFSSPEDFESWAKNNPEDFNSLGVSEKKNFGAESGSNFTSAFSGLESTSGSEPPSLLKRIYDSKIAPQPGAPKFDAVQNMSIDQQVDLLWSTGNAASFGQDFNIYSKEALRKALSSVPAVKQSTKIGRAHV